MHPINDFRVQLHLHLPQAQNNQMLRQILTLFVKMIYCCKGRSLCRVVDRAVFWHDLSNREKCKDWRSWSRMLAIACYPFSQALELEIHASNEFIISNQHQTAVSSFGYSSVVSSTAWYVLLRYALCGKTVLERLQFRYFSWQSSHHQAYLAVAGDSDGLSDFKFRVGLWSLSLFCQCDLSPVWINSNSLERVWNGPSVRQLYRDSTALWGRAGDRTYLQLRGGLFRLPSPCHCRRTAPSRLALLSVKKARGGKISQPSTPSCSLWIERSIRSCSSAIPGASVLHLVMQCTDAQYQVHHRCTIPGASDASIAQGEKVVGLAGYFRLQQLASLIPGDLAKCGVNSACRIAPCPQVIVKFMTLLKPNVYVAWVCEQPVHFCFEPSTKDVSWMIWAVREIRVGVSRFPVYAKLELHHCGSIHGFYIEVEKIDPAVLSPVEHSRIGSASSWWHALPFQRYYGFNRWIVHRLKFGLKSVQLCGRAGPDHKNVV